MNKTTNLERPCFQHHDIQVDVLSSFITIDIGKSSLSNPPHRCLHLLEVMRVVSKRELCCIRRYLPLVHYSSSQKWEVCHSQVGPIDIYIQRQMNVHCNVVGGNYCTPLIHPPKRLEIAHNNIEVGLSSLLDGIEVSSKDLELFQRIN